MKAAASLKSKDWRVLAKLRDSRGDSFEAGIVLYTGEQTIPLGDRIAPPRTDRPDPLDYRTVRFFA